MTEQSLPRTDTESRAAPRKRRGRKRWVLLGGIALLLAAVYFAPVVVARTSLRQRIVPLLLPDFRGQVTIGAASLGWFSPIELRDVVAVDEQGRPLFEIGAITSEKELLAIAAHSTQLGKFQIENPRVHVLLRSDGSNLEDAFQPLLDSSDEESTGVEIELRIAGGRVKIQEAETGRQWTVDQLEVALSNLSQSQTMTADVSGRIASSDGNDGSLHARFDLGGEPAGDAIAIDLQSEQLPLEIVQPVLRRVGADVQVAGRLTADCRLTHSSAAGTSVEIAQLAGRDFRFAAPWLNSDQIRLAAFHSRGKIRVSDQQLVVDDLTFDSELAKVAAAGSVHLASFSLDELLTLWQTDDYRISGEVDLARLAETLPNTLRIRAETRITSGKIALNWYSRVDDSQRRSILTLETSNLSGTAEGRPIHWPQPIQLTVTAAQADAGWTVEHLECKSNFLTLTGAGGLEQGSLTMDASLHNLAAELGKFVDLSEYELAGSMHGELSWKPAQDGRLAATGGCTLDDVQLVMPSRRAWREPQLVVDVSAVGTVDRDGPRRLDEAIVNVQAGTDTCTARLAQPIDDLQHVALIPLACQMSGKLTTWLARVEPWLPLEDWNFDGDLDVRGELAVAAGRIEWKNANVHVIDLQAAGAGLHIDEPEVRIATAGQWNNAESKVSLGPTTLTSSTVAFRADNVLATWSDQPTVAGNVAFRGDMARLSRWWQESGSSTEQISGMLTGNIALSHASSAVHATMSAKVTDASWAKRREPPPGAAARTAAATDPWEIVWQEKELSISGKAAYQFDRQILDFDQLDVASPSVRVVASGVLSDLAGRAAADVHGQVVYDLAKLTEKLRPYLGPHVKIEGAQTRDFSIQGPLIARGDAAVADAKNLSPVAPAAWPPNDLAATASIGWSSANVFGMEVGKGELMTKLAGGVIDVDPLDVTFSEGRLKMAPRIFLLTTPAVAVFERGPIVEQARFSPEMCESWLKYVAPLVANATRAEGRFSVDLAGAKIPLAAPAESNVRGVLKIHAARIGPGPFGQQILMIVQQIKAIRKLQPLEATPIQSVEMNLPPQEVEFHMVDGRVYHQGLVFMAGDAAIRTRGSVGADQSLDLIAEIPIRDEWIAGNPLLASVKGTVVQVPITGSLSKPKLDNSAVASLLRGSVENLLEKQLIKGLDGIFRRN